jgi:hypothetical protein
MEERTGTFTAGTRKLPGKVKRNVLKGSSAASVGVDAITG